MNKHLKAFTILAWIGVAVNLAFAVPAFFAPDFLIDRLGIDEGFETVWLRNAGLLIFLVTFYTIAVALAPARYPAVSWIVAWGRFLAGLYWFQVTFFGDQLNTTTHGSSFSPFLAGDIILSTLPAHPFGESDAGHRPRSHGV